MRCVAIITVRNGIEYIDKCIQHLVKNRIEVAVIDQSSEDGTYEICQGYKDKGLFLLRRVKYPGYFSLENQLTEKYRLIDEINTDWVIHQDVDECLISPYHHLDLYDAIKREDDKFFNVINFNEFVFLPYDDNLSFYDSQFYYFFEPFSPRLMRAWKKDDGLDALHSGGHVLKGAVRISPNNYSLLHYIFTSQQHAYDKYSKRVFEGKEVERGWHRNRLDIEMDKLRFPDINTLSIWSEEVGFRPDITRPWRKHFWE